jgi:hypothetical protein
MEKRIFLTLPGHELGPLGRPARSQSLYRLLNIILIDAFFPRSFHRNVVTISCSPQAILHVPPILVRCVHEERLARDASFAPRHRTTRVPVGLRVWPLCKDPPTQNDEKASANGTDGLGWTASEQRNGNISANVRFRKATRHDIPKAVRTVTCSLRICN